MKVGHLLAEVEHLDKNALEQMKKRIAQRESELHAQAHPRTLEEWTALSRDFLNDFWMDTEEAEKETLLEAMREKNKPPKKDH